METINSLLLLIRENLDLLTLAGLLITNLLMIRQNKIAKQTSDSQNLIDVINFLQDEDTRKSRKHVFTQLKNKPQIKWTTADFSHAQKVCTTYDIAGRLMKEKFVDSDVLVDGWRYSIIKSHKILERYLSKMNKQDPGYWSGFEWLYKKTSNIERAA